MGDRRACPACQASRIRACYQRLCVRCVKALPDGLRYELQQAMVLRRSDRERLTEAVHAAVAHLQEAAA